MPELYVANTDNKWFDFLAARQPWEEVNFWKPSQQIFRAIDEGGLFVFRLKSPRNMIGGFGVLASSINATIKLSWDSLGEGNGVSSIEEMRTTIARYRGSRDTTYHSMIGCRILVDPVFLPESLWFEVPRDWSNSIVTGKVYNTRSDIGAALFAEIEARQSPIELQRRERKVFESSSGNSGFSAQAQAPLSGRPDLSLPHTGPRFGSPTNTLPRLGQAAFRMKIAHVYEHACAVSGTRVEPALEAAHIRPFGRGGEHSVQNGVYLRRDIHSVIDSGYACFDNDLRFVVSDRVKADFNNGNEYLRLRGKKLSLPKDAAHWPDQANIVWHRENVFESS